MIRGVWMWPENVFLSGAEKIISILKKAGFTDIYFLTKGLSGKTAFPSSFAPHAYGRDLLKEVIFYAHRQSMKVHAWFTSASDEHYKSLFPESGRAHFSRGKDKGLISFKDEGYLSYLKSIVSEVVSNYPVDGIHLDYIRYNHMLYGWDDKDISSYEAFGADKDELFSLIQKSFFSDNSDESENIFTLYKNGNPSLKAFFESRKTDVLKFAKEIVSSALSVRSSIFLSSAVMPEGAYSDHSFADLHYGQVHDDLSPLFDYLVPMAYSKAYGKNDRWVNMIGENLKSQNIPFVMGLQAYDNCEGRITQNDIKALSGISSKGYALFREGEFAFIYEDSGMRIYNDTPYTITKIALASDKGNEEISVCIHPHESIEIHSSYIPDCICAFSQNTDVCVFYDKSLFALGAIP